MENVLLFLRPTRTDFPIFVKTFFNDQIVQILDFVQASKQLTQTKTLAKHWMSQYVTGSLGLNQKSGLEHGFAVFDTVFHHSLKDVLKPESINIYLEINQ